LPTAANGATSARSAARVDSPSAGTSSPSRSAVSAAITDGPPDTVTTATRRVRGRCVGMADSVSMASKNSSVSSASTTRALAQAAR
jgi:hypothetical protein